MIPKAGSSGVGVVRLLYATVRYCRELSRWWIHGRIRSMSFPAYISDSQNPLWLKSETSVRLSWPAATLVTAARLTAPVVMSNAAARTADRRSRVATSLRTRVTASNSRVKAE